jgi:hypothetical protein
MRSVAVGIAAHRSIDEGRVVEMSEVLPAKYVTHSTMMKAFA